MKTIATLAVGERAQIALAQIDGEIAKDRAEAPAMARQAKRYRRHYDALNVHDHQFDASDALVSTAISMAAVAALCENMGLVLAS